MIESYPSLMDFVVAEVAGVTPGTPQQEVIDRIRNSWYSLRTEYATHQAHDLIDHIITRTHEGAYTRDILRAVVARAMYEEQEEN